MKPNDCIPAAPGYYWATTRKGNYRCVVLIAPNGNKHLRAFTCRDSSSRDPQDFKDYSAAIVEKGH